MANENYVPQDLRQETAFLVGAQVRGEHHLLDLDDSLDELALLADTAGLDVVGRASQRVHNIDPSTFIGSGKVEEIREMARAMDAQVIIFDDELSPRHNRELEKRFGSDVRVIDRSVLILDIFAQHARTHEGSLQVELAQYEYRLPRLTRAWTHLARQAGGGGARGGSGGVGLRGPGETQLEVDRREISAKITKLRNDLERVRTHREVHRRKRKRSGIPVVSLVGYTNAGKSTLLRAITGANTYVADQLFATLDPLTRRTDLPSGRAILLTDTVGFIQKLPTTLIAAFRATLEEVREADILLHVVDGSHANVHEHIETVEDTLAEIDMPNVPRILVWNKCDMLNGHEPPRYLGDDDYTAGVYASALQKTGTEDVLQAIEDALSATMLRTRVLLPYQAGDLVSLLHDHAIVEEQEHTADGVILTVQLPRQLYARFIEYQLLE